MDTSRNYQFKGRRSLGKNRHEFCHYRNRTYIRKVKSLTVPESPSFLIWIMVSPLFHIWQNMFELSVEIQELNLIVTTNLEILLSFSASKFRFNGNIQANCQLKWLTRQPASQPTNQPINHLTIYLHRTVFLQLLIAMCLKIPCSGGKRLNTHSCHKTIPIQSVGSSPQHHNLFLQVHFL